MRLTDTIEAENTASADAARAYTLDSAHYRSNDLEPTENPFGFYDRLYILLPLWYSAPY